MKWYVIAVAVMGAGLLIGCQHKKPPEAVATSDDVKTVQGEFVKIDPKAKVGLVIAVKPEYRLAAVSEIPVQEFKVGDAITIVDKKQNVVQHGMVVAITSDALHVKYNAPGLTGRNPRVGDLAIRVANLP